MKSNKKCCLKCKNYAAYYQKAIYEFYIIPQGKCKARKKDVKEEDCCELWEVAKDERNNTLRMIEAGMQAVKQLQLIFGK